MAIDVHSPASVSLSASSRAARVAFLLDPRDTAPEALDEILRRALQKWGGRFYGLFPCDGTSIDEDWWRTLCLLDPDIIVSLARLSESLVRRINRQILPVQILDVPAPHVAGTGPQHRIRLPDPLVAVSVTPLPRYAWATRSPLRDPVLVYLQDNSNDPRVSRFALLNFGLLPEGILFDTAFRDTPHERISLKSLSEADLLRRLKAFGSRALLPIDLCSLEASVPYSLGDDPFHEGLHIVLGEALHDIAYAWNRALAVGHGVSRNSFWLPPQFAENEEFLSLVAEWLELTHWKRPGHSRGAVVSYSQPEETVQQLARRLSSLFQQSFIATVLAEDRFPNRSREQAVATAPGVTQQVPLSEHRGFALVPRPHFLPDAPSRYGWMVDLRLQDRPERYRNTNRRPSWHLTKRLGVASRFVTGSRAARVTSGGRLSALATAEDHVLQIAVPSDESVVGCFLDFTYVNYVHTIPNLKPRFERMRRSDKGKYLEGLLGLFGGLTAAGLVLGDPFWRDVILHMAGEPEDDQSRRRVRARAILDEFFAIDSSPVLPDSPRFDALVDLLGRRLILPTPAGRRLSTEQIRGRFQTVRRTEMAAGRDLGYWSEMVGFDTRHEEVFRDLVDGSILRQGSEASCPGCGSRIWYSVDDLRTRMTCAGCGEPFALGPDSTWQYQLNDLVRNALRYQGALPVIQALNQLQQETFGQFLFLPQQDIFERGSLQPFTDLDLVAIRSGVFLIGEVKSEASGFRREDFERIGEVAEELEPHEVLLTAPGTWPPDVEAETARLAARLRPREIEVKRLSLSW